MSDLLNEGTYVYLLQSCADPKRRYIGLTTDLSRRIQQHNAGRSTYTSGTVHWDLVVAIWFADRRIAERFERYLKHGSGHAFARRHFW